VVIYKVTNFKNNKVYIGQTTAKPWGERAYSHLNGYGNDHMKNAVKKYGKENFKVEVICVCPNQKLLDEWEIKYIAEYDSTNPAKGYNKESGGKNMGSPSEETRKKMSKNSARYWKGKKHTEKACKKMRKAKLGKKHSKETIEKIRKSLTGRKFSEEHCKNLSKALTGIKRSKETCEKIRKAQQGEKNNSVKLTEKKVISIRAEFKENVYGEYVRLARKYGVNPPAITNVILRKTWKHI